MVHELAGKRAPNSALADIPRLVSAYYTHRPDVSDPLQRVSFGTSGHRGDLQALRRELSGRRSPAQDTAGRAGHRRQVEVLKDGNRMNCNCKIGKVGGVCLHQMAIFLMLYSKNAIKLEDFPFNGF